jgi:hypothetical protein
MPDRSQVFLERVDDMSAMNSQRSQPESGLFRHVRAGAERLRGIRRQRADLLMARNARWVTEARLTPPVQAA